MHHTFIVNLPDQGAFRCATGSASDKQLSLQSSKRLIISFYTPYPLFYRSTFEFYFGIPFYAILQVLDDVFTLRFGEFRLRITAGLVAAAEHPLMVV